MVMVIAGCITPDALFLPCTGVVCLAPLVSMRRWRKTDSDRCAAGSERLTALVFGMLRDSRLLSAAKADALSKLTLAIFSTEEAGWPSIYAEVSILVTDLFQQSTRGRTLFKLCLYSFVLSLDAFLLSLGCEESAPPRGSGQLATGVSSTASKGI